MDIAAMKLAAEAASQSEWSWDGRTVDEDGYVYIPECSYLVGLICLAGSYEGYQEDCDYIVAAQPKRVLELIASHERLLRVVKAFTALHEMPNSEGVQALAEIGYDGNTTLTEFVRNLRDEALAAAGE